MQFPPIMTVTIKSLLPVVLVAAAPSAAEQQQPRSAVMPKAAALTAGLAAVPKVPSGHPRLYARPPDIPRIKANLEQEEFKQAWSEVQAAAASNHPAYGPFASAFVYLVTGDRSAGRRAIENGLAALSRSDDARTIGQPMHWAACIYDWCYGLLTDSEKQSFVKEFQRIAASHGPYYPARMDTHAVVGHDTEGWLLTGQLPAGVAIYDESPVMYDAAARVFMEKFVPVRAFYYPAHAQHQGDSYSSRMVHDLLASWLFRRMDAGDVLSREQRYVPYETIYNLRPDGRQFRHGDTYDEAGRSATRALIQLLAGTYYDDPYMLWMADSSGLFNRPNPMERVFELLFRKPGAPQRPISELPLTKFFGMPVGTMIARTGWGMGMDSRTAVVRMHIGGNFFGNHQRKDWGNFQIYYRGPLAISSGIYEGAQSGYNSDHWRDWYHQTIAHNSLLVFDPNEKMVYHGEPAANDGGQRWPAEGADHPRDLETLTDADHRYGRVTAHAIGPDTKAPAYSYIAGDITKAYTKKVSSVTRSMVTWNTGDARYPAVLVVFDRVVSADPSFKKTWLLHTIQEPQVQGRTVTAVRDTDGYRGKLAATSLLPERATLTRIGGPGKDYWIESAQRNYATTKPGAEGGAWRIEVSPAVPAKEDVFLHAMTVMDSTTAEGPQAERVEASGMVGARVLGRVVLFSRSGSLQGGSIRLNIPGSGSGGSEKARFLVCDLQPGQWSLQRSRGTQDGAQILTAAPDGKCVYFEAEAGEYVLTRRTGAAPGSSANRGRQR